ncbi:MAG TPA: hypothetical protein VG757_01890 [Devosia sp.]|nr:hypothetical protein [Devosia sp.]
MPKDDDLIPEIEALPKQPWRVRILKSVEDAGSAVDEVVVSIAHNENGEVSVELQWLGRVHDGQRLATGYHRAANVPMALLEAHVFGATWGFKGVAVSIDPQVTWDPAWGEIKSSG